MEELVFRTAQERDVAAIETLERQCFAVPWSYESLYHDVMKNRLASYIVAEADGATSMPWIQFSESKIRNTSMPALADCLTNSRITLSG